MWWDGPCLTPRQTELYDWEAKRFLMFFILPHKNWWLVYHSLAFSWKKCNNGSKTHLSWNHKTQDSNKKRSETWWFTVGQSYFFLPDCTSSNWLITDLQILKSMSFAIYSIYQTVGMSSNKIKTTTTKIKCLPFCVSACIISILWKKLQNKLIYYDMFQTKERLDQFSSEQFSAVLGQQHSCAEIQN